MPFTGAGERVVLIVETGEMRSGGENQWGICLERIG